MTAAPLVVGAGPGHEQLAAALGAAVEPVPSPVLDLAWSTAGELEAWRTAARAGAPVHRVVVALLAGADRLTLQRLTHDADGPPASSDDGIGSWLARTELPFAQWFVALAVAAARCADGGRVVAVVDRPDPLEGAGHAELTALAAAVETTARSLAQRHADRGVGIHVVTTDERVAAHAAGLPITVSEELVVTVAMVLDSASAASPPGGLTRSGALAATVVRLGSGR